MFWQTDSISTVRICGYTIKFELQEWNWRYILSLPSLKDKVGVGAGNKYFTEKRWSVLEVSTITWLDFGKNPWRDLQVWKQLRECTVSRHLNDHVILTNKGKPGSFRTSSNMFISGLKMAQSKEHHPREDYCKVETAYQQAALSTQLTDPLNGRWIGSSIVSRKQVL